MDPETSFVRFVVLQKVEDGAQLNSIFPFQLDRDLRRGLGGEDCKSSEKW